MHDPDVNTVGTPEYLVDSEVFTECTVKSGTQEGRLGMLRRLLSSTKDKIARNGRFRIRKAAVFV